MAQRVPEGADDVLPEAVPVRDDRYTKAGRLRASAYDAECCSSGPSAPAHP